MMIVSNAPIAMLGMLMGSSTESPTEGNGLGLLTVVEYRIVVALVRVFCLAITTSTLTGRPRPLTPFQLTVSVPAIEADVFDIGFIQRTIGVSSQVVGCTLWIIRPASTGGLRLSPLAHTPQPVAYQAGSHLIREVDSSNQGLTEPSVSPP